MLAFPLPLGCGAEIIGRAGPAAWLRGLLRILGPLLSCGAVLRIRESFVPGLRR